MNTNDGFVVKIDTREQKPYSFHGVDSRHETMDTGDYSVVGFDHLFAVERKTLNDLANTLGRGRTRFTNEVRRANGLPPVDDRDADGPPAMKRFVVVIEADRSEVANYTDDDNCPSYYSNIHPNSVIGTVDKWPAKFDVLDFVWAGSRPGGKALTLDLLRKWHGEYRDDGIGDFL